MASVSEIRHHISAVDQTRKITNAMQMVSSARMKKFSGSIPYNAEYFKKLRSTMKDILESSQGVDHPYLRTHRGHRRTYIVVAGDKEMAGSYNANILNMAYEEISRQTSECHVVTVGMVATQFFRKRGIEPEYEVAGIADDPFPLHPTAELFEKLAAKDFPVLSDDAGERMQQAILAAREELDSVGGIVECAAIGLPAGLGDPMFDGVENRLAAALFGIPAVKGVEFGAGFAAARSRGSENNDAFSVADGAVVTDTNHAGGILGGITNGMPILLRTAMKPTPSIARAQKTVRLSQMEEIPLEIRGRHDPCIAHRAVPVVEAVTAAVLLDLLLEGNHGTF